MSVPPNAWRERKMRVRSVTADVDVGELAKELAMSEQDLLVQSLRSFIAEQLRLLRAEKQARCARFGVTSLEEMDRLISEGAVEGEEILDDFQNVDYLTARIEHLERLLETLQ
jgi:hypothetical protein